MNGKNKTKSLDLTEVTQLILQKIKLLEYGRDVLKARGNDKAMAVAGYEKQIAITIIKLKNGEVFELEGNRVEHPPATVMNQIAKGVCWKEKIETDKADAMYKSAIVGLETLRAEINALQSINRYQSEV